MQLKKSFCYDDYRPEIAEVYVRPEYRKQRIASRMILFAEEYCRKTIRSINLNSLQVKKTSSPNGYTINSGIKTTTNFICQNESKNRDISRYRMDYRVDDKQLNASVFLEFVNQIWPGSYDVERTQAALSRTLNITAYDDTKLTGCLRILSDGYYFGTITELLVLPEYQKKGIGSKLLQLAKENTPTMLYFGSQPGTECFYEKMAAGKVCNPTQ